MFVSFFAARRLHLNAERRCFNLQLQAGVLVRVCVCVSNPKAYMVCRCQYRCPASTSALASTVPSGTWRLAAAAFACLAFICHAFMQFAVVVCNVEREGEGEERGGCGTAGWIGCWPWTLHRLATPTACQTFIEFLT